MKKILYVITKGNYGGAQRYVFDLATHFKDKFDVSVASGNGEILEKKLREFNIPMIKIPKLDRDISTTKDIKTFFFLMKLFRKEKPDIIHLNSAKIGGVGALAGRLVGIKKIVFTVHGFAFNEDRPFYQKLAIKILSWFTLILVTDVIFVSEFDKRQIKSWLVNKKKKVCIHNGVNVSTIPLDRESARKELVQSKILPESVFQTKTNIISIGELTKNKNHILTILALKEIPETNLIIMGDGEDRKFLEKKARDLGVGDRVCFAGFVKDASKYLKAFDIFVLSSLKEGLPYVLLEAGTAGLAVVASNIGGVPDIITDGENGMLAQSGNKESFRQKLSTLVQNQEKRKMLGLKLREKVTSEFTLEKMLEATMVVYLQTK